MKRIGIVGGVILVMFLVIYVVESIYINYSYVYENKNVEHNNSNLDNLTMMLETSSGSGEYQESKDSGWPSDDYKFNSRLSKCKNGSELSWDDKNKQVLFSGNKQDKCYVYFDIKKTTLAEYVKSQYTGVQGQNNLYLHNSTLENGAGDNSYRYAGSSETTNNFVCFGYDSADGTCPTDNLYRIIGVFDNEVKLIKYDYALYDLLGNDGDYSNAYASVGYSDLYLGYNDKSKIGVYTWNKNLGTTYNTWSDSFLNKTNLNINYLNNIGESWSNKIANHTWQVYPKTEENITSETVPNAYQNEVENSVRTYDAKVGLMYVSDYGYAATSSSWETTLNNYNNSSITKVNWMYMGLWEWTITPCYSVRFNNAFSLAAAGNMFSYNISKSAAIRPVFYLESSVAYVSGNGTISSPILIN